MIKNCMAECRAKVGKRGLSKAELSYKLRVNRSYITRLEKGCAVPGLEMAFRMADCLNCGITDVFKWIPEN
jgi:DNA-binding XRE family transcriptional regulator